MPKNKFSSENQPDASKKGRKAFRDIVVDALHDAEVLDLTTENKDQTERVFVRHLVTRAFDSGDNGSTQILQAIVNRMYPPPKAITGEVFFEFDANKTPIENIQLLQSAVSNGEVSIDVLTAVINSYKVIADIEAHQDFKERIEAIEALLNEKLS